MVRSPDCSPPDLPELLTVPKITCVTCSLQLITPMFGGGYEAGICDDVTPFRASSIRGHLRFWWRAVFGAQYATIEEMRKAENALWGDTTRRGLVDIITPDQMRMGRRKKMAVGSCFTVQLIFSPSASAKDRIHVKRTMQTWIAFGGLGTRTRAGYGAVASKNPGEFRVPRVFGDHHLSFPHLAGALLLTGPESRDARNAMEARKAARAFRRGMPSPWPFERGAPGPDDPRSPSPIITKPIATKGGFIPAVLVFAVRDASGKVLIEQGGGLRENLIGFDSTWKEMRLP